MSIDPQEMGSCFKFDHCGNLAHPNGSIASPDGLQQEPPTANINLSTYKVQTLPNLYMNIFGSIWRNMDTNDYIKVPSFTFIITVNMYKRRQNISIFKLK